jgi:hypothetical protein
LEKNPNERGFPTQEADNGGGGPKSGEGLRPRCAEPTKQAHQWKGQLTGVLLQGEAVAHVEKGGMALGGFSSRSGKRGRRNGGAGVSVRVGAGEEMRAGGWTARAVRHCSNRGASGASDAWAPAGSRRERERRETGRVGRPEKKGNGPSPKE